MTDRESLRIIIGWVMDLADLCRHGEEGKPTKAKAAVYATMLAEDFPSGAFTAKSLHHVVRGNEWFPAYDVIRGKVADWWRENRPAPLAVSGPVNTVLTGTDGSWERYFYSRQAQGFAPIDGEPGSPGGKAHVLSVIRQCSPKAYAQITGDREQSAREPSEWERAYVSRLLHPEAQAGDGRAAA